MLSFIRRQAPTGFDDIAEFQEFEPSAPKPTLTIARRHCMRPTGMQRFLPVATGGLKVVQRDVGQEPFATFRFAADSSHW